MRCPNQLREVATKTSPHFTMHYYFTPAFLNIHDPPMIAQQTSVHLLIVNEPQTNQRDHWFFSRSNLFILSWYVCTFRYGRLKTGGFWVFEFLISVDEIAVSASSNWWDPVSFSRQWPHFFEEGHINNIIFNYHYYKINCI